MLVTTIFSLSFLFKKYMASNNYLLLTVDIIMICLALGMVIVAFTYKKKAVSIKDKTAQNRQDEKAQEMINV